MTAIDDAELEESLLDDDIEVPSSPVQSKSKPAQLKPKPNTPSKPAAAAVFNVSAYYHRRLILYFSSTKRGAMLM